MKILFAASEMAPFVKTGGLGDVLGALPRTMAAQDQQVMVFIPRYRTLGFDRYPPRFHDRELNVELDGRQVPFKIVTVSDRRLAYKVCFIVNDRMFARDGLYVDPSTGKDYSDNDERFAFFGKAVLAAAEELDFVPDIVHAHDWQTGPLLGYLRANADAYPAWKGTRTVLTIHNLAHQGGFEGDRFPKLGLPDSLFGPGAAFEFYGKVSFLKAAIHYADKITTVSPRYAREIQTEEFGCGLEGVLRQRKDDLVGILNGVDYTVWSPSRDRRIPYRYRISNLGGKRMTKVELMNLASLPLRDKVPLIGMISRLAHQKGFDLIAKAADQLFALPLQMIVLGIGDEKYHQMFEKLQERYPDKLRCFFRLDEDLAHMIEAGADVFLMPSLFEPCGLNQIYSLKYGTVPVVHEVGGLADTIQEFNPEDNTGNGFVFTEPTADALVAAIERAVGLFGKRRMWGKIVKNGMRQDFSWQQSVQAYLDLYRGLLAG